MSYAIEGPVPEATDAGPEFDDLFRDEYVRLARALFLLTGSRTDAEEIAEEAMFRVFERWAQVRDMESPIGYLYRTALNLAHRRFRLRRRESRLAPDGPDDTDDRIERRVIVRSAVRKLSREQREALVLTDWVDLSAEEAGSVLGISADAVRARTHRARETLRTLIGGFDG